MKTSPTGSAASTVPCLVGPTGVGKTAVALRLCLDHQLEIISADSRQIYQGMDIGTAKPTRIERSQVRFHCLDLVRPDQVFNAADFARAARRAIADVQARGRRVLVVGGSGLYLRALFAPLFEAPAIPAELRAELRRLDTTELVTRLVKVDPDSASRLHPHDRQRILRALEVSLAAGRPFSVLKRASPAPDLEPCYVGILRDRAELTRALNQRFDAMLEAGLIDEVRQLAARGYLSELYAFNALGYKEIYDYLEGKTTLQEAAHIARSKTRAYARRQMTWFRRLPGIRWVTFTDLDSTVRQVEALLLPLLR